MLVNTSSVGIFVGQKDLAALLAAKRSAGVEPEANLSIHLTQATKAHK